MMAVLGASGMIRYVLHEISYPAASSPPVWLELAHLQVPIDFND
jgi:hypothetical protein